MVSVNAKSVTFTNGTANDATQVDSEMTSLFNNDATLATAVSNIEVDYLKRANLSEFLGGLKPAYASASTITVAKGRMVDSGQNIVMATSGSSTVDLTVNNAVNGMAQSANALAGTVGTGGSSSTTITGSGTAFNTDFMVGDVIWTASGARRITNVASATSLTVESAITLSNGTAYKRGGEAPNTFYNLYMIYNGSASGFLLSTRNVAGGDPMVDLPTGYTRYNQLPFALRNDGSNNILPFMIRGWGREPFIEYRDTENNAIYQIKSAGTDTSFTNLPTSTPNGLIPAISRHGAFGASLANLATGALAIKNPDSASSNGRPVASNNSNFGSGKAEFYCSLNASQQVAYKMSSASVSADIYVLGFWVTEVPGS